jgi:hypothetical protein
MTSLQLARGTPGMARGFYFQRAYLLQTHRRGVMFPSWGWSHVEGSGRYITGEPEGTT